MFCLQKRKATRINRLVLHLSCSTLTTSLGLLLGMVHLRMIHGMKGRRSPHRLFHQHLLDPWFQPRSMASPPHLIQVDLRTTNFLLQSCFWEFPKQGLSTNNLLDHQSQTPNITEFRIGFPKDFRSHVYDRATNFTHQFTWMKCWGQTKVREFQNR